MITITLLNQRIICSVTLSVLSIFLDNLKLKKHLNIQE